MTTMNSLPILVSTDSQPSITSVRPADDWQRRFGVPWDRVDRAARAVLERAAAASKRKFSALNASMPVAEVHAG